MLNFISRPTTLFLYAYLIVTQVATGVYMAAGVEPSAVLSAIGPLGLLWGLTTWFQRDLHDRGLRWTIDAGLLLYVAWLLVLPFYLIRTRGLRGIISVIAFAATYLAAQVAGILLYMLFGPIPL